MISNVVDTGLLTRLSTYTYTPTAAEINYLFSCSGSSKLFQDEVSNTKVLPSLAKDT